MPDDPAVSQTTAPRLRRLSPPMKPTPAMLAAAREDEDGWRRMPTSAVRHTLLWEAALSAMDAALAGLWRAGPVVDGGPDHIAGVDEAWLIALPPAPAGSAHSTARPGRHRGGAAG